MEANIINGDILGSEFLEFYQPLHEKFTEWQQKIVKRRKDRTKWANACKLRVGYTKEYKNWPWNPFGPARPRQYDVPDFAVTLPEWCIDQRNQMTGPADNASLIVKMLRSEAPGVMVDLEDSQANNWENTSRAYANLRKLFNGSLALGHQLDGCASSTVLWIRPRGLHMKQVLRFPSALSVVETSASLLDVCMTAFNFSSDHLPCSDQPLAFYIPKTEYAEEAEWWAELLKDISKALGWPSDYIKCMALVESHSFAYQIEEFSYLLRDHLLGLNLGRWDYMASLIEMNLWDPEWVLPDRNTIPHDVAFFQNLRKHMVNVCHKHGLLAIGGMTALYPSRKDAELNDRALKALEADKKNEAAMGLDGAWTGHPDQNQIAVDQFPEPNQINFFHYDTMTFDNPDSENSMPRVSKPYDLRPSLEGGSVTLDGTRQCIRVAIRYRNGVLNGKGASLLDGYMEDLATDRICRLMISQRMKHTPDHTSKLVSRLFDEELDRLLKEGGEVGTEKTLRKARLLTEHYIVDSIHTPN